MAHNYFFWSYDIYKHRFVKTDNKQIVLQKIPIIE